MLFYEPFFKSAKKYAGRPTPYLYAIFIRVFATFIALFAAIAALIVFVNAIFYFSSLTPYAPILTALAILLFLAFFFYFWAAFKGAMVHTMMTSETGAVHMRAFLQYAFKNGLRFFSIFLIKNFFLVLVNIPFALVFILLHLNAYSLPGGIVLLLALLLSLLVKFIFEFSYISAAAKELSAIAALKGNFRFIAKNFLAALTLFLLHLLTTLTLLIPIFDIFSLITLYPAYYLAAVDFYRSKF